MRRLSALILCLCILLLTASCSGEPASDAGYTPAVTDGNVYQSTYLGLGAKLPANFTAYTTEQLEELNGFSLDVTTEEFANGAKHAQILYDLYASSNNGDAVDIQLENLVVSKLDLNTAAAYAHEVVDDLKTSLEQMGYQEVTATVTEFAFAGGTHPAITATAKIGQFTLYQTVVLLKVGDHVARITAGSFNDATVNELLSAFYAL